MGLTVRSSAYQHTVLSNLCSCRQKNLLMGGSSRHTKPGTADRLRIGSPSNRSSVRRCPLRSCCRRTSSGDSQSSRFVLRPFSISFEVQPLDRFLVLVLQDQYYGTPSAGN